jgi:hypothetical protein
MSKADALNAWKNIENWTRDALAQAPRNFCALECLANDPLYAKPDSQKMFILWAAKPDADIRMEVIPEIRAKHPWVLKLFMGQYYGDFAHFIPFNTWDTERGESLSWERIEPSLLLYNSVRKMPRLPRWSTASRSCLVLIPEDPAKLPLIGSGEVDLGERHKLDIGIAGKEMSNPYPNVPEWKDDARREGRFFNVVRDFAKAVGPEGIKLGRNPIKPIGPDNEECRYRLYSLKTGVSYVGSMNESKSGKHRLETNSSLAMVRSAVIRSAVNKDRTFGVLTEVLTVTAPLLRDPNPPKDAPDLDVGARDGFQVRELTDMNQALDYMPAQTIPYARKSFDGLDDATSAKTTLDDAKSAKQCAFWRKAFAVPLGRAKARLFLNYGLVHMSANAQNFVLGFDGTKVRQFVARDLGDTSWHDEYLTKYFQGLQSFGDMVFRKFSDELPTKHAHTLRKPDEGAYPPPRILRLATQQVLTHAFGHILEEKHHWNKALLYDLAAGVLDGFREYVEDALFDRTKLYATDDASNRLRNELKTLQGQPRTQKIQNEFNRVQPHGQSGMFPPRPPTKEIVLAYTAEVDLALQQGSAENRFKMANSVRQLGEALTPADFAALHKDTIDILISAEELFLCAGLELRLGTAPGRTRDDKIAAKIRKLLENGNWPLIIRATT